MSYHFTAPRLWVEQHQFAPLLWLPHPLFSGQPHTFIALGMLLGSDRLAMGLIYLGGVLTVLAVFAFARRIVSSEWSLAAALAFLLAPMTYWQVSVSGAPDIWIAFYAILSLLALSNAGPAAPSRWFLLAAVFGGLAASGKYPAWAIPAILAVLILFWTRSLRASLLFAGVAVLVGIPPQFRNWLWTGDPFFPFLLRWFPPQDFNAHFVECIVNDSKSPFFELSIGRLLAFPFLLVVQGERYGVGHYFGPLGLLFAPSMLLLWGKGQAARLGLLFSAAFFLLNALTSQMARFLLPAFPVVMALALAGMAEVVRRRWRWAAAGCWGSLGLFFLFGAGSLGLYAKQFLPVALGLEREDVFLRRMAADYQVTEFVNLTLESDPGKVMVFYRHPYYLRVPFVYAEPLSSWGMNPRLYDTPEKLRQLLYRMDIRYVVRAPWYPPAIRSSFERLEQDGTLRLVNHTSVENFSNWRVTGRRTSLVVAVFRVEGNHVR